jgi:hypothetical protein
MVWGFVTATVAITDRWVVSTNAMWSSPYTATSRSFPSGAIASPCGVLPTSILAATRSVTVSITLTSEEPSPLI